jgi:hypothetical protein
MESSSPALELESANHLNHGEIEKDIGWINSWTDTDNAVLEGAVMLYTGWEHGDVASVTLVLVIIQKHLLSGAPSTHFR